MSSPYQVISALSLVGLTKEQVFIHPLRARLSTPECGQLKAAAKAASVLVVLDYQDFVAQLPLFNNYPKTIILVAPVLHTLRLTGPSVEYLDVVPAEVTTQQVNRFFPLDIERLKRHDFAATYLSSDGKYLVSNEKETYLPKLIDSVRAGSLLNKLMTAIYSLGNVTEQKAIKNTYLRWMVEEGSDWDLLREMLSSDTELSQNEQTKVITIIRENGGTHLTILAELRKDKTRSETLDEEGLKLDTKKIEKKYPNFDVFELRYLLKAYSQLPYDRHIAGKTLHEVYYGRERNARKQRA